MRGQSPLICNNWRHKHHLVNPTITLKYVYRQASLIAQLVKNLPAVQETWVQFLSWEDPLEKEMATHSSILTWRIPWTEEPGRLQSMRSQESDTTYGLNHHHHHHTDTQNLSIWGFRGHIDHAQHPFTKASVSDLPNSVSMNPHNQRLTIFLSSPVMCRYQLL